MPSIPKYHRNAQPGTGPAPAPRRQTWWAAGWNMPGYLPESAPALFETWGEARTYLAEEIDRLADGPEDDLWDDSGTALLDLGRATPGDPWDGAVGYVRYWLEPHPQATLECDRCLRPPVALTVEEYEDLLLASPGFEYETGRLLVRCTAWPESIRRRALGGGC